MPAAAVLDYPHRHNDCHAYHERDADLVLLDLQGRPAMCGRCAAWNIISRVAANPTSADRHPVTVGFAPSRWQDSTDSGTTS